VARYLCSLSAGAIAHFLFPKFEVKISVKWWVTAANDIMVFFGNIAAV
jgi:hypothetical protein